MNITGLRVVLDTKILIAIIGRQSPFRWMFDQLLAGQLSLCVSNEILLEYQEILAQKTSREVADNISHFLTIHPCVEKIEVFYQFRLIIEELVSNDKHFQVLKQIKFPKVNLFTLPEFVQQFS